MTTSDFPAERELVIDRYVDAPRDLVWRCWTDPELLVKWFTPAPWKTRSASMDVRAGGSSMVVMESPEGELFPNPGIYLEVVEGEKLVFTDAYTEAWAPSEKPFMTGILTFADEGKGTRYRAVVRHWSVEDSKRHEEMGFHDGWGKATDQLEETAKSLAADA
ncbi:uncharacterized protein YndB with AHSA1/START domain [Hoeflea marina]|uniref:Uncharacterized protein YndB with AHSA1/START domain n=2 Tax=Hoeflea marina TaxID=274592 RepID=A0A317PRY1_9HYPH|nr:uncharacterized protein YndB with AHSA1/START domain [Hoeflea marina]